MSEKPQSLLVLEFNELCPPLLNRFMAKGSLPNFRRLHDRAEVFITKSGDRKLEPWVQWVSYHTGQAHAVHGINELDQGRKVAAPQIWDRFAEAGK